MASADNEKPSPTLTVSSKCEFESFREGENKPISFEGLIENREAAMDRMDYTVYDEPANKDVHFLSNVAKTTFITGDGDCYIEVQAISDNLSGEQKATGYIKPMIYNSGRPGEKTKLPFAKFVVVCRAAGSTETALPTEDRQTPVALSYVQFHLQQYKDYENK